MTRLVLALALALAIFGATSAHENTSIALKDFNASPFQNNIAYKFFEKAAYDNKTLTEAPFTEGDYNYMQCKTEARLILDAMNAYQEWGLQCKYKRFTIYTFLTVVQKIYLIGKKIYYSIINLFVS